MFSLENYGYFLWPLILLVISFVVRRFAIGEGKLNALPLTLILILVCFSFAGLSLDSVPKYQVNCLECIDHNQLLRARAWSSAYYCAFLTIGSFLGWVALVWKNRDKVFDFG